MIIRSVGMGAQVFIRHLLRAVLRMSASRVCIIRMEEQVHEAWDLRPLP